MLIGGLEFQYISLGKNQPNATTNQLKAFINQIKAQKGKKIGDQQAEDLIAEA